MLIVSHVLTYTEAERIEENEAERLERAAKLWQR